MSVGRGGVQIFCFFFLKKENRGAFTFGSFSKRTGGRETREVILATFINMCSYLYLVYHQRGLEWKKAKISH